MTEAAQPKRRIWLWVLGGLAATCAFCSIATLGAAALGLVSDDDTVTGTAAPSAPAGSPGIEGGFALAIPKTFKPDGEGRWITRIPDGSSTLTVELIKLSSLPGLDRAPERLKELWTTTIARDWSGVQNDPFILRRFMSNGARAHFTGSKLRDKKTNFLFYVTCYLVEAGDRLEPLVFVQGYGDGSKFPNDMMAGVSWSTSYPAVEAVIAQVKGSPVGLPLVSDDEVEGHWGFSSTNTAQWVNTLTGSTSMTSVAYASDYVFDGDHRYTYAFKGASGQMGAANFSSERGAGEWKVEHDLLVLTGDDGKVRKSLITNAGAGPDGRRTLLLIDERRATVAPFAMGVGELYVEER